MLRGPKVMLYRGQVGEYEYRPPEGALREGRTFTCQHCNKVVFVPPMADPADLGGLCKLCMGLICPTCAALGVCDTFEAKLERIERAAIG